MKRVLFVTTVEITVLSFLIPYLKYFSDKGYEVHVACSGDSFIPFCHVKHNLPFERQPFKLNNLKSLFKLHRLMVKNRYKIVHCHTPVASILTRVAAAFPDVNAHVLYTAHGFQFCKNGSLKDWFIYYPVEKIMSCFTDTLITINEEDFNIAKRKFYSKAIYRINGIGVDLDRFQCQPADNMRQSMGIEESDFILLCVGELNANKNQEFLIESISRLMYYSKGIKLLIAGSGSLNDHLINLTKQKGLANNVMFLGYRHDIPQLMAISDVCVSASLREGLPVNILEAMSSGKPIVATDNRGHRELVKNCKNGFLIPQGNIDRFCEAILTLYSDFSLRNAFGKNSRKLCQRFSLNTVISQMDKIYRAFMD